MCRHDASHMARATPNVKQNCFTTRLRLRGADTRSFPYLEDAAFTTDKYTCGECMGKNCSYMNVNGYRDIGKNETWGSKDSQADDGRVLVKCHDCKSEWNETVL